MSIVLLTRIDGSEIGIDPSEVFALEPVPSELLSAVVPAGTYINDGQRLAVVGTVAQVAALLDPPVPPPPVTPDDMFGTRVIVGNVPAGDPNLAQAAPFQYIPDPGDGTGIAEGLAAIAAGGLGGTCKIRRGLYDFGLPTSPPLPLIVESCHVIGEGSGTLLRPSTLDRRLMLLTTVPASVGRGPHIENLGIDWTTAAPGASGTEMIDTVGSVRALVRDIDIIKQAVPVVSADESLTSIMRGGVGCLFNNCRSVRIDSTVAGTMACFRLAAAIASLSDCATVGGDIGCVLAADFCQAEGNSFLAFTTGVLIESPANSSMRVINNRLATGVDGIVLESGSSGIITANETNANLTGDGIRVEAGALDAVVSLNKLNGNPLNILEPSTLAALNLL